jgi:hypothetical protein
MKNNSHHRLLTPTPSAFRMYEENYKDFMSICGEERRKPAELLRDAIDEWLQIRRAAAIGGGSPLKDERLESVEAKIDELRRTVDQLNEKLDELSASFDFVRRRDHAYLLEIFMCAYGARDILWKYISNKMRGTRQPPESIETQYQAMEQEWSDKTNSLIDRIRTIVRKGINDDQARSQST